MRRPPGPWPTSSLPRQQPRLRLRLGTLQAADQVRHFGHARNGCPDKSSNGPGWSYQGQPQAKWSTGQGALDLAIGMAVWGLSVRGWSGVALARTYPAVQNPCESHENPTMGSEWVHWASPSPTGQRSEGVNFD